MLNGEKAKQNNRDRRFPSSTLLDSYSPLPSPQTVKSAKHGLRHHALRDRETIIFRPNPKSGQMGHSSWHPWEFLAPPTNLRFFTLALRFLTYPMVPKWNSARAPRLYLSFDSCETPGRPIPHVLMVVRHVWFEFRGDVCTLRTFRDEFRGAVCTYVHENFCV